MQGEPDTDLVRIGPFHSVSAVRRKPEPLSGYQEDPIRLAIDPKARAPLKEKNPLIGGLVEPDSLGGDVAHGQDSLEANAGPRKQGLEDLLRQIAWDCAKKIKGLDEGHDGWAPGWSQDRSCRASLPLDYAGR